MAAVPGEGYVFEHWSGMLTGTDNPKSVYMDKNKTATANFVESDARCTLDIALSPGDGGTVTVAPPQPAGGFIVNKAVMVTAVASERHTFNRWEGGLAGSTNPTTVVMDRAKTVTAIFDSYYVLTVRADVFGTGTVTVTPAQPSGGYVNGTTVTVTAVPEDGYEFDHWSGAVSSSDNPLTVSMASDTQIAASFKKPFPWLSVVIGVSVVVMGGLFVGVPVLSLIIRRRQAPV